MDINSCSGKRVLVTGHTGFKGSWLCRLLCNAGAEVTGYALDPPTDPSLYVLSRGCEDISSVKGDIRDLQKLQEVFSIEHPEIVIHMAAQPIVKTGYDDPLLTYSTNIMGTANLLECVRQTASVRSVVVVTTDKVYRDCLKAYTFKESDELGGTGPYAGSKSCAEIITENYRDAWLAKDGVAVSALRAGNSIGGGDFGEGRILTDCMNAALTGGVVRLRHPESTRPYQHVLEAVGCYLYVALRQLDDPDLAGAYNVGPACGSVTAGYLAESFRSYWNELQKDDGAIERTTFDIETSAQDFFPETSELDIDSAKIREKLGWKDHWTVDDAVRETAEFALAYKKGMDIRRHMDRWINKYMEEL